MRSILRAVREKLEQFRRVLTEAGGSDEDLIFHIRRRPSVCQAAIRVALISLRRCVMSVKTSLAR